MSIKTVLRIAKFGITALTIIPPAVEVAMVLAKLAKNGIENKVDNSETLQEIKKRYKLRSEEGIITVDYTEV